MPTTKQKVVAAPPTPPKEHPDRVLRYQFTSLNANSNKFYNYNIYDTDLGTDVRVIAHFGRVGDRGQWHDYGVITQRKLNALIQERVNVKHYAQVELHAVRVVDPKSPGNGIDLSTPVGRLSSFIYEEAGESISRYLSTTVDQLSQNQIMLGREYLDHIRATTAKNGPRGLSQLVQDYYTVIPTKLPHRIDAAAQVDAFVTPEALAEQEERLNQLEAAIASYAVTSQGGTQASGLGAQITALDPQSDEYRDLAKYVMATADRHAIRNTITGIYAVTIEEERKRYLKRTIATHPGNAQLLFHGTRNPYVRHILRQGLIIPNHVPNGRSLGNGIYFANRSEKAVHFCTAYVQNAPRMLLLCEVALGKCKKLPGHSHSGNRPPTGFDSILSPAGGGWNFDEIVVFNPSQVTLRYLVTLV